MIASKATVAFIAALMTWSLFLTACSQKKDDSKPGLDARARNISPTSPGPTGSPIRLSLPTNSSTGSMSIETFEANVVNFLAAAWDPSGVGAIDENSVVFTMNLSYLTNGQIDPATSKIRIWVTDQYAYEKKVYGNGDVAIPFVVSMDSTTGTLTGVKSGNQVTATFRDTYQELTVAATLVSGSIYNGTLSFRNLQDKAGQPVKSAQPMGYFSTRSGSF